MAQDSEGTLWMTTQNSGLISYKDGKFSAHLSSDSILYLHSVIYIDEEDRIWGSSSERGWFMFENNSYSFFDNNDELKNIEPSAISESDNGVLWFATNGNGIYKYENSKFTNYTHKNGLISNWTNTLYFYNHLLWIGTDLGLCSFDGENFLEEPQLSGFSVNAVSTDAENNVWLGTRNGLFLKRFNTDTYERLNTTNGLSKSYIIELLLDKEGSLWIINYRGGLTRIKNGKFTCYSRNEGMPGMMVNTVCEIEPNTVLAGFDNGRMVVIKNNRLTKFETKKDLYGERIRDISKDSKENLWISTYSGLLKISPSGDEKWYSTDDGFPDKYVRSTFEDSKNNIWIGTRNNGIIRLNEDETYTVFNKDNGLNCNLIMSIDEDKQGNLLVGTSKGGLNIIKNNSVTKIYTEEDGLTSNIVFGTYVDNDGIIWIAAKNGLNFLKDDKITSFYVQENMLIDSPFDILEDDKGNLWLPCSNGIMKINKQNLFNFSDGKIDNINCILYDKYDGLKQAECNSTTRYLKTQNGMLWFPTLSGLTMINPDSIPINNYIPPVYIEELTIDNESISLTDKLIVAAGKKRFIFKFNALSYFQSEENLYKYILEGFENQWNEATNKNSISYTNLSPGKYTFKVIACNNDGIWNETGAEFTFKIKPRLYETFVFNVLIFLFVLSFIFLIYKIRVKNLIKKQHKLEQIIQERTSEITEKSEELVQQNEEISQQAEELSKLSIVASNTENAVIIYDQSYNLEWANDAYIKIYGEFIISETTDKNRNLLVTSSNKRIKLIVDECINEKKSITFVSENTNIHGENIWVQTTLTPIFEYNTLKNLIVIESDISELKKAHINISLQKNYISSSIKYAKSIQDAILPLKEEINKYLNNFIIFKPKDVVSGDFYWFLSIGEISIFAIVDCTGHGVPGAFMSMMANDLLNQIIIIKKILNPKEILTALDENIRKLLKQDVSDNVEGMDIGICVFKKKKNNKTQITFAGSKLSLYYHKYAEKKLKKIKGARKSIGGVFFKYKQIHFENEVILLEKNDMIYMNTDGYIDQNNRARKRFGTQQLMDTFIEIADKDLLEQKTTLELKFDNWKQDEIQRDDVTLIGIKI